MERMPSKLEALVMSAEEAVQVITSGMTVAMSGFTSVGYPKETPAALIRSGHARDLTLLTGASVGDDLDGALARAGIVSQRHPYQSNKDMRNGINAGNIEYADLHLSHMAWQLNNGWKKVDVAVIDCIAITEEGLIPTLSIGANDAFVYAANKVIVELNTTVPQALGKLHDVFRVGVSPNARPIPILKAEDRVGETFIPCPMEKIAAIIVTDKEDIAPKFKAMDATSKKIGENVVNFIKSEVAAGHLPEQLPPIQSGVGSVGNAVLGGFMDSGLSGLSMYTEVAQDSALELLEAGIFDTISTTALSLSEEMRNHLYEKAEWFAEHIVLRPQELSNHCEVIRRLGLIALNTPIELDIYGNVNSTHVMGSQMMNGIGGSGDFTRNARLNIFATESVAKGGLISCIVPMVSHVDHTEHDVHVIVTEQGVADLRWKSPKQKAEAIIENCTHPDYRPMLREYFERAKAESKGKHTPHDLKEALSWHQRFLETGSMK